MGGALPRRGGRSRNGGDRAADEGRQYYRTEAQVDLGNPAQEQKTAHHKDFVGEDGAQKEADEASMVQSWKGRNFSQGEEDESSLMAMGRAESENEDDDVNAPQVPPDEETGEEDTTIAEHTQLIEEIVTGEFRPTVDQVVEAAEEGVAGLEAWSGEILRMTTPHIS